MRRPLLIVGVGIALVAAGCGGGNDSGGSGNAAAPTTAAATGGGRQTGEAISTDGGDADPKPGQVLLRFVRAAGKNDTQTMWNLLSEPTQAAIGPTFDDFDSGQAQQFELGLGSLAGTARVILSRRLSDTWSVAAIRGERTVKGKKEVFAYGAALLPEQGALKLELGGVVVTGYEPEPLGRIDDRSPRVGANVGAGGDLRDLRMWLDGKPFAARRGSEDTPFTATLRGEPPQPLARGPHEVVVFAGTSDTATATAWVFFVEP